uniref:Uncharacterized protein n=1 Tax=Sphaerodactylus townsendi TaxID=933632 RepID=A0ACB8F1F5_9SAUR
MLEFKQWNPRYVEKGRGREMVGLRWSQGEMQKDLRPIQQQLEGLQVGAQVARGAGAAIQQSVVPEAGAGAQAPLIPQAPAGQAGRQRKKEEVKATFNGDPEKLLHFYMQMMGGEFKTDVMRAYEVRTLLKGEATTWLVLLLEENALELQNFDRFMQKEALQQDTHFPQFTSNSYPRHPTFLEPNAVGVFWPVLQQYVPFS